MGYSFRLAARVPLYAPSYRLESTYQGLCHSCGQKAGMRNSSLGPLQEILPTTHSNLSGYSTTEGYLTLGEGDPSSQ